MKTQVELFEVEDVRAETPEQCAEAQKLIVDLGLKGQLPVEVTKTAVRFPYRLITDEEEFVYKMLCPSRSDVHTFNNSPIPLEVLKTVAYAKSLDDPRIAYIEVWAADSSRVKDPILVGRKSQYHEDNVYILARWGEELLPLQVLLPEALKIWWAERQDLLNGFITQINATLAQGCPKSAPKRVYTSLSL